jgi:hypothetical protein
MGSMCNAVKKVEIWVTCAPTKSDRNISYAWLENDTFIGFVTPFAKMVQNIQYPKLLNNASILINDILDSIFPPFQLNLLKIGVQHDKLN